MNVYEAILPQDFDISKLNIGKLKKQTQGSVANMYYNGQLFQFQTPLMNTFGVSQSEDGKYSLCLMFSDKNVNGEDISLFKKCIEDLEDKIIGDISKKFYKEWLNVGDKWDKYAPDMRKDLVEQKMGNKFLRYSKEVEKNYAPTMNLKINKKRDTDDLYVNVYMMDSENRIITDEKGEQVKYDVLRELMFSKDDKRMRPRVYCVFGVSIWIVNTSIYLSPTLNQVLIQPPKQMVMKVEFNKKGFLTYENDPMKSEDVEDEDEDDVEDDDDEMPQVRR